MINYALKRIFDLVTILMHIQRVYLLLKTVYVAIKGKNCFFFSSEFSFFNFKAIYLLILSLDFFSKSFDFFFMSFDFLRFLLSHRGDDVIFELLEGLFYLRKVRFNHVGHSPEVLKQL